MTRFVEPDTVLTPPTEKERLQALAALERAALHREELLAARRGRLFTAAGVTLDGLREQRTLELP